MSQNAVILVLLLRMAQTLTYELAGKIGFGG
jgi:hypothetical protein